jgi:hypothetical protein
MPPAGGLQRLTTPVYGDAMQEGANDNADGGQAHRPETPGRRVNANYRHFGTILFLGALAMILLMVLLHR